MNKTRVLSAFLLLAFFSQFSLAALAALFRLTEKQEITVGAQAASQVEKSQPILNDSVVTQYVTTVGNKLVANSTRSNIPYRFRVVNSKDVNAFALPGGFIYVNRGLIEAASTENEFIGVLAHEVGHVTGKHGVEQVEKAQKANLALGISKIFLQRTRGGSALFNGAQLVTQGAFLKFSRDHEREADRLGAEMMHKAGWNPQGMVSFFDKLAQKGDSRSVAIFSTHPAPAERRNNIADLTASWGKTGTVDSTEFQKIKARLKG
ncbi:MAG: M48 family metallopeptidase [Candidatus Caenarcaniphilales bacterium]|nr:M48 family metallopeptidase [Candidatus Caenarcaniphilales bacterium]